MLPIDITLLTIATTILTLQTNPANLTQKLGTTRLAPYIAFTTGITIYLTTLLTATTIIYLITLPSKANLYINTATLTIITLSIIPTTIATIKALPRKTKHKTTQIKICTSNTLWTNTKGTKLAKEILNENPDIIFLQEYGKKLIKKMHPQLNTTHPYNINTYINGKNDLAIYSKHPLKPIQHLTKNILTTTTQINNTKIQLINIHTTSPTNKKRYKAWLKNFKQIDKQTLNHQMPKIICGDFNATIGHHTYRNFLKTNKLKDMTIKLNTWSINKKWIPPFMHLDHIATTNHFTKTKTYTTAGAGTDHCPVYSTINIT